MSAPSVSSLGPEMVDTIKKTAGPDIFFDAVVKLFVKGRGEDKAVVITATRILVFSIGKPCKLELSVHLLDIYLVQSLAEDEVCYKCRGDRTVFFKTTPETVVNAIACTRAAMKISFPLAVDLVLKYDFQPASRGDIVMMHDVVIGISPAPCGSYSRSYVGYCDLIGVPVNHEIVWDIDNIYAQNNTKEFSLNDVGSLEGKEAIPVIQALTFNPWFTKLSVRDTRVGSDALTAIVDLAKRSRTLEEIIISSVNVNAGFVQALTDSLTSNVGLNLQTIDLSGNLIEDKGIMALSGALQSTTGNLSTINVSHTGCGPKGAVALSLALRKNVNLLSTLNRLNLSDNPILQEGLTAILDFLAMPNAITHLNLSNTGGIIENVFAALQRGCGLNLSGLDLSNNKFTLKKGKEFTVPLSFDQFFQTAGCLKELNLANTKIPDSAIKSLFNALFANPMLHELDLRLEGNDLGLMGARIIGSMMPKIQCVSRLDISDNDFTDEAVFYIVGGLALNTTLKHLSIAKNFKTKSKERAKAIKALNDMLASPDIALQSLSLGDCKLKTDIVPVLDVIGANETLTYLDVTGNGFGDKGAGALAKALQLNRTLLELHWDDNQTSIAGFQEIAYAMSRNPSIKRMATPIQDVAAVLKTHSSPMMKALMKIEAALQRNNSSAYKTTTEDTSTAVGPQMLQNNAQVENIDRLIIQARQTISRMKELNSPDAAGAIELAVTSLAMAEQSRKALADLPFLVDEIAQQQAKAIGDEMTATCGKLERSLDGAFEEAITRMFARLPGGTGQVGAGGSQDTALIDPKAVYNLTLNLRGGKVSRAYLEQLLLKNAGRDVSNKARETCLAAGSAISNVAFEATKDFIERQIDSCNQILNAVRESSVTRRLSQSQMSVPGLERRPSLQVEEASTPSPVGPPRSDKIAEVLEPIVETPKPRAESNAEAATAGATLAVKAEVLPKESPAAKKKREARRSMLLMDDEAPAEGSEAAGEKAEDKPRASDAAEVPKEAPKEETKASPKPAPKEEPKAAPKEEPKAAPKEEPKPAPKEEPKAAPKEEPKPAPKEEPKAAPKEEPKPAPKEEPKAAPKEEPKPAPKETLAAEPTKERATSTSETKERASSEVKAFKQERVEAEVDLNAISGTGTLSAATKERPKGTNRRPPTRRPRPTQVDDEDDGEDAPAPSAAAHAAVASAPAAAAATAAATTAAAAAADDADKKKGGLFGGKKEDDKKDKEKEEKERKEREKKEEKERKEREEKERKEREKKEKEEREKKEKEEKERKKKEEEERKEREKREKKEKEEREKREKEAAKKKSDPAAVAAPAPAPAPAAAPAPAPAAAQPAPAAAAAAAAPAPEEKKVEEKKEEPKKEEEKEEAAPAKPEGEEPAADAPPAEEAPKLIKPKPIMGFGMMGGMGKSIAEMAAAKKLQKQQSNAEIDPSVANAAAAAEEAASPTTPKKIPVVLPKPKPRASEDAVSTPGADEGAGGAAAEEKKPPSRPSRPLPGGPAGEMNAPQLEAQKAVAEMLAAKRKKAEEEAAASAAAPAEASDDKKEDGENKPTRPARKLPVPLPKKDDVPVPAPEESGNQSPQPAAVPKRPPRKDLPQPKQLNDDDAL